ncbi:HlyD family secretion protein [Pirellulimonas nuda]|uniref:HlyD family secretion protein n=1 Tax=Pirellulimonas nuda TaxID=2528009 RepID=A0A518DCI1_9BACT|nr:HlyD family efflux transporter periplasmic adaptor subunit [Pirellulimonas nuda]QDU89191.1 HlyD family secretion protein [Pirellulimonas nuda]
MPDTSSKLDLRQLAVERDAPAAAPAPRSRAWLTRYVVPAAILAGFLALFGWAARDSFLPATPVTVTPVVVSQAQVRQEGTPLFQAAGWIEPRPSPVTASALAPGVISEVLVVEGQHVKLGEPVATLIDTDARLALRAAQARHELQLADVRSAEAELAAANVNLARPFAQQAALADAQTNVAKIELELGNLPFAVEAAVTRRNLAAENLRRKQLAGGAIPGRMLREAQAELDTAETAVRELSAREPALRSQLKSLGEKRTALSEGLSLLTEPTRAVAAAQAALSAAKARADQTALGVESARLQLERMVVRSPIDGCVLSLDARPGQWLSGVGSGAPRGGSAVVGMYDPRRLQVRVDVRLEDVPKVQIGQPALIETAALTSAIAGEVISVTTLADIQKNTLQVKVAINDPPAVIKPEMLGKVTFVAPAGPEAETIAGGAPLRMFIPQALVGGEPGSASVWVADLSASVARKRSVEIARGATDTGLVEVQRGLQPTDKLIVEGRGSLSEGDRIRVRAEERVAAGVGATPLPSARVAVASE